MDVIILVMSDMREGSQRQPPTANTHNYYNNNNNNNVSCLVHKQYEGNHCSMLFCVYIVQKVGDNFYTSSQMCFWGLRMWSGRFEGFYLAVCLKMNSHNRWFDRGHNFIVLKLGPIISN